MKRFYGKLQLRMFQLQLWIRRRTVDTIVLGQAYKDIIKLKI